MEHYLVKGGRRLEGAVRVHGAKNSVLPILAACACCKGRCEIHNCPKIADVETACRILERLGCRTERRGAVLTVDASGLCGCALPEELACAMRSSILFLGALLARCGEARLCAPGGCALGARPIDQHLYAMERLGAYWELCGGSIVCRWACPGGARIDLRCPSVGATENAMLAALGVPGETEIHNAAREPEIVDLACFLRAMGAELSGEGSGEIHVRGGLSLHGAVFTVMPDRMETASYLCIAAGCGGDVFLQGARRDCLEAVTSLLERSGCQIGMETGGLRLRAPERLRAAGEVVTAPYPGFPTDAQAPAMAALLRARGTVVFTETVFEDRMRHVAQFRRLGAEIESQGCRACVRGVPLLHGADLEATDLRCGAALMAAALQAEGESRIFGVSHVRRGYEDLTDCLCGLGAEVRLCEWIDERREQKYGGQREREATTP